MIELFLLVTAICTYGTIHTPLTMSYQIGGTVLGLLFPLLACILVLFTKSRVKEDIL